MKRMPHILAIVLLTANVFPAFACVPTSNDNYAKTDKRVRERFDSADSVVLLSLLDVKRASKVEMGIVLLGEKAVFRIDRVFKGPGRAGQKLTLTTFSTCATYLVQDWDAPGGPVISSRQWLIYRNQSKNQMPPHDMAQPMPLATFDLQVLGNLPDDATRKAR